MSATDPDWALAVLQVDAVSEVPSEVPSLESPLVSDDPDVSANICAVSPRLKPFWTAAAIAPEPACSVTESDESVMLTLLIPLSESSMPVY